MKLSNNITREMLDHFAKKFVNEMGDSIVYKVADLDKIANHLLKERESEGMSMNVTVMPIKANKFTQGNTFFSFVKDPKNSVFYGIPVKIHPDGNIQWRRVFFMESEELDLNNAEDRRKFVLFKLWHNVEGSPFEREPKFKFFDEEEEAIQKLNQRKIRNKAIAKIESLSGRELITMCRVMEIKVDSSTSKSIILDQLYSIVETNPEKFLDEFNDELKPFKNAVYAGAEIIDDNGRNLIDYKHDEGYIFMTLRIGLTPVEAALHLRDNKEVYQRLVLLIDKYDKKAKELNKQLSYEIKESKDLTGNDGDKDHVETKSSKSEEENKEGKPFVAKSTDIKFE